MTGFIIIGIVILLAIVVVQIGKVSELSARIRGEEDIEYKSNKTQGKWLMGFLVLFMVFCTVTAYYFKNYMLGYGPHESASDHGGLIDNMFDVTLVLTGIVFVITHIALFWFGYRYHGRKNGRASFIAHNNTLEIIWSAIPAFVMTFLVVKGLVAWNDIMADTAEGEDFIEIEATGYQFAWHLRYPGPDGALGERNFRLITGTNPLGQDWNDVKNLDDLHPSEIVLPIGKKVRVRIMARDVLHNFYLPQFRVKMDAIPGIPTYFVFTPNKTTEEYREELSKYPEYNKLKDPADPDSKMLWEEFNYELACAELCGASHFSMRRLVKIVSQEEYDTWLAAQRSYYLDNIRLSADDPFKETTLDVEVKQRREDFNTAVESALSDTSGKEKIIVLEHVQFATGGVQLTANSQYEITNIVDIMKRYPTMRVEVSGHTDNTGDAAANLQLSRDHANVVYQELIKNGIEASRLTAVGLGSSKPRAENTTEEGRQKNRRTEFKILSR